MKLPVLWIALACIGGIELSRYADLSVPFCAVSGGIAMVMACLAMWRNHPAAAWTIALITWIVTGATAGTVSRLSVPADKVARLIASRQIDTSSPLRWRGRLRADPLARPWGRELLIDLEQVELPDSIMRVSGGLRVTLYGSRDVPDDLPQLRAGDRVECLVKAAPPRNFNDPGAFDARSYLAAQGVDLTGSLRNAQLLTLVGRPSPTLRQRLARLHGTLLARVDHLFSGMPATAAVIRAMLLGDRSFVETSTATAFQKTASYHVLVVAGLHTSAIVAFLLWLCRRLRLGIPSTILITLAALAAYVAVVEDRPPIFRAGLMAAFYLLGKPLFRRSDLLNTVSLAALSLLLWNPAWIADSSFQLSFVAAAVIAMLGLPWIERATAPYVSGLAHLGDVTRDVVHPPKIAQFRIEMRAFANWLSHRLPGILANRSLGIVALPSRLVFRVADLFLLSVAIQLGMLPLLAQDFHRVSFSGPISNIPAVLLTGLIVPLGFACLAISFAWRGAASAIAGVVSWLTALLLRTIEWFGHFPRLSYRIPAPFAWVMIAFFAALIVLAAASRCALTQRKGRAARRKLPVPVAWQEWTAAAAVTILAVVVVSYPFHPRLLPGKLEVTVLDVGQGDSIFAAFPNGQTMLVDGGGLAGSEWIKGARSAPDVGEEVVSPYLWSRGLKKLDVVALTHAHQDHLGGLLSVVDNFRVRELWIGRDENTPEFRNLLAEAQRRGVRVVHKTQGEQVAWSDVRGHVLWPPAEEAANQASNEDSLVLHIEDGSTSFLLTGDIEQKEESEIATNEGPIAADFLKVPHHGSKTSSTSPFLAAVRPQIAVISVGAGNAYGHPAASIVERYAADNVNLLRTDRDGAVTASSDGRTISVQPFLRSADSPALAQEQGHP